MRALINAAFFVFVGHRLISVMAVLWSATAAFYCFHSARSLA